MSVLRRMMASIALLGVVSVAVSAGSETVPRHPDDFPGMYKVSAVLADTWRKEHRSRRKAQRSVEAFVRISGALSPAHRAALEEAGFIPRSVIPQQARRQRNTILTGSMRLADVPAIAALAFVLAIEGASRLGPKHQGPFPVTKSLGGS